MNDDQSQRAPSRAPLPQASVDEGANPSSGADHIAGASEKPKKVRHGIRMPGMALTDKQEAIWELHGQGKTREQIGIELGISGPYVTRVLGVVRKKLGIQAKMGPRVLEESNPEKVAAIIDALSVPEPYVKIQDAFKEAGLPPNVTQAVLKRLRVKYNGAITELKAFKTSELIDAIGKKISLALEYMDDKVMAEANFRDLALATTAMIEKRQLLRGEPTQIISDNERKKLHELLPDLIAEARRRGVTIEGRVEEKIVEEAKP